MPRVETIGAAAGRVRGTGAVLGIGAIDALCEQIVAGADRDGEVLVLCGTTLIVWTTIPEARQVPGLWTIPHTDAGMSKIGGASNAGGLFLGWVDRVVATGRPGGRRIRGGVPVWSPYIRGERTPFHDPDRRAVLDALDLTHDAASLRRAAYEASGFVVRQLIELSGAPVSRIVATGGGTRLAAVDAGHRRCHRPAGGGVRGGRGRGTGSGLPRPHGGRPGNVHRRRGPLGRHRRASSIPIPPGPLRSRIATDGSWSWETEDLSAIPADRVLELVQ